VVAEESVAVAAVARFHLVVAVEPFQGVFRDMDPSGIE
jgi:hypothetical protein